MTGALQSKRSRSVLGVLACAILGGCWTTPAAKPLAAADVSPPGPIDWPPRATTKLNVAITAPGQPFGADDPRWIKKHGLVGNGFLFSIPERPIAHAPRFNHLDLTYVTLSVPERSDGKAVSLKRDEFVLDLDNVSTIVAGGYVTNPDRPPRGTCLFLTSINGTTVFEEPILFHLLENGWRVIVQSSPQTTFMSRMYAVPDSSSSRAQAASVLGREMDEFLCDPAYAAEGFLRWAIERDPAIRSQPVVVIGASMGAICAPAAVARIVETGVSRVDAAVLIAGGSNLFRINRQSPITQEIASFYGFHPANDTSDRQVLVPLNAADEASLYGPVMAASSLDPGSAARWLRGIPVLQLHACLDGIVPAELGDDLYERLGKPERWCYLLGHQGLFVALPWEASSIERWIDHAVANTTPSADPQTTPH